MSYEQLGDPLSGDAPEDYFGSSVSLSDDGTTLAIGAYGNDVKGSASGQVKLFKFNETTVNFKQHGPSFYGKAAYDNFGDSVALSSDGNTLVVGGSPYAQVLRCDEDTSVYKQLGQVIDNVAFTWHVVALSDDGKMLAVGSHGYDKNGYKSGQAKVYNIVI